MKTLQAITKKQLLIIVALETLIIVALIASMTLKNQAVKGTETMAASPEEESLNISIRTCLDLPVANRAVCATEVGKKIASIFSTPTDQLKQCLKFRPNYVHECQLGLKVE